MADQESITLEVDPRSVLSAVKEANKAVEGWEKGTVKAGDAMQRSLERMSDMLIKLNDRSRSSMERLTRSIERRAEAYGKTGAERLLAERDRIIKQLGDEAGMVDRVTKAYNRVIEVERKRGGIGGEGSGSFSFRYAFFGAKDLLEGRYRYAIAETANELISLGGKALIIGGVAAAVASIGYAAVEVRKKLKELSEAPELVAAKFLRLNDATKTANDEMRVANDRLGNAIAKLENRPQNGLKLAFDEAAVAADHLTERMDKSLHSFLDLMQKTQVGFFGRYLMGHAGTQDISKLVGGETGFGGLIGEVYGVTSAGKNPTAVLNKYRDQVQRQLEAAEKKQKEQSAEAIRRDAIIRRQALMAGVPILTAPRNPGYVDPRQQERIEKLQALLRQINGLSESYSLERQNSARTGRKSQLDTLKEQTRTADEERKRFQTEAQSFVRRGDESELSAIEKIYYQRDLLLKQAAKIKGVESDIAAVRKSADQQAGVVLQKSIEEFNVYDRKRRQSQFNENFRSQFHQMLLGGPSAAQLREAQRGFSAEDQVLAIEMQGRRDTLNRNARRAQQIVGLSGATGMDAIRAAYSIRIDLAKQLAAVEAQRISKEEDSAKRMIEMAQAQRDFQKQTAEAQEEALLRQLELQKQQFDTIRQQAGELFNTLFTHPQDFGRQLGGTVRAATLKPITEGLSNIAANALHPLIYGANGQGGIAGLMRGTFGQQDPVKIATDMNTTATAQNSAAIVALTNTITALGNGGTAPSMFSGLPTGPFSGGVALPAIAPSFGASFGRSPIFGGVGPGGTPGFVPGPLGIGGGSTGGMFAGFRGIGTNFFNHDFIYTSRGGALHATTTTAANIGGLKGNLAGVLTSQGAAALYLAGGTPIAMAGLTGSRRGTLGGFGESVAGGALVGAGIGTMIAPGIGTAIGAGIGAAAGGLASGFEKLFGVESPENEAKRLIRQIYHLTINDQTAHQIVALAKQSYAGQVSIAVRSPEVRQMLSLYAAGTGQNVPLSASIPRRGSLLESGGALFQQAGYQFGRAYRYQSNLPVAGGLSTGTYPNPGPMSLSISIGGKGAGDFLAGNVVTPDYVQAKWSSAASASNGRLANAATIQQPGLYVS